MLLLKLLLVPGLVAAVTLAVRRWGPAVGGWLAGLPVVAGPVLVFYAIEQGDAFLRAVVGFRAFLCRDGALAHATGSRASADGRVGRPAYGPWVPPVDGHPFRFECRVLKFFLHRTARG